MCFTRNPATGEKVLYGEYLPNAQGEDVVAGIRTPLDVTHVSRAGVGGARRAGVMTVQAGEGGGSTGGPLPKLLFGMLDRLQPGQVCKLLCKEHCPGAWPPPVAIPAPSALLILHC